MSSSLKIYSVTHKPFYFVESDWIEQIFVGKLKSQQNLLNDSTGVNIAKKNQYYNEITAQYWIRHNRPSRYVGFCHYRRYFMFDGWNVDKIPEFHANDHSLLNKLIGEDQQKKCLEILSMSDLIVPRSIYFPRGLKQHYIENDVPEETWEAFKHFSSVLFPETKKYIGNLTNSNFGHMRNMYIMRWELFTSYIDHLIPILDAVFKEIGGGVYPDPHKNRYPGYLAEHFFNLWLCTQPRRKFEVPIIVLP